MTKGNKNNPIKKVEEEKDEKKTTIKCSTVKTKTYRAISKPKKDYHTANKVMTGEEQWWEI
jgi:hypothetical protein